MSPTSISQAIGLAKLVETKIQASKQLYLHNQRQFYPKPPNPQTTASPTQVAKPSNSIPLLPTPPTRFALPAPPSTKTPFPIKYLSPTEMDARRAKGLCFNYHEIFFRGHSCKTKPFLLLMADEDEPPPTDYYILDQPDPPLPTSILPSNMTPTSPSSSQLHNHKPFHLSMQALTGQPSPKTLRFMAFIDGHKVSVLIDPRSSHNILQSRAASFLNISTTPIETFKVMVGNGALFECNGFCPEIPLVILSYTFQVPFYLFPIQGADVVLGVQWLQSVVPFVADFSIPSMQFHHQGSLITLQGDSSPPLTLASFHQFL